MRSNKGYTAVPKGDLVLQKIQTALGYVFLVVMLILYPLKLKDKYYEMAGTKWQFFLAYFGIYLISFTLISLIRAGYRLLFARQLLKRKPVFLWTDGFVLCYLLSQVCTFAVCDNQMAAWIGTEGWYMGAVTQVFLALLYFVCSRTAADDRIVLIIGAIGALLPSGIAVLQRLGYNVFYLYYSMPDEVIRDNISTIGNRTWFSGFLCVAFPAVIWSFFAAEKVWQKVLSSVFLGFCFETITLVYSDSGIAAAAVLLYVMALLAFRRENSWNWFAGLLCGVSLWNLFLSVMIRRGETILRYPRGISAVLLDVRAAAGLLAGALLLFGIFQIPAVRKAADGLRQSYRRVLLAGCIIPAGAFALIILVILLNTAGVIHISREGLLYFSDYWGDMRGFNWKITCRMFANLPMKNKLFGVGQDCFAWYAYSTPSYADILQRFWDNATLTNAHNEFLNLLLCNGIFGASSYLGIFCSMLWMSLKAILKEDKNLLRGGIAFAVTGYLVHNFFCYQQITAVIPCFILLGLAGAQFRREKKETTESKNR